jgi:hypothetical protein
MDVEIYFSAADASHISGLRTTSVARAIRLGRLRAQKTFDGRWQITRGDLIAWLTDLPKGRPKRAHTFTPAPMQEAVALGV